MGLIKENGNFIIFEEAIKVYNDIQYKLPKILASDIKFEIEKAKKDGKCYIEMYGNVSKEIVSALKNAGYIIRYDDYNSILSVKWVLDYETVKKKLLEKMKINGTECIFKCGISEWTLEKIHNEFPHIYISHHKNEDDIYYISFNWAKKEIKQENC